MPANNPSRVGLYCLYRMNVWGDMRKCHLFKQGKAIILHVKHWKSELISLQDHSSGLKESHHQLLSTFRYFLGKADLHALIKTS